MSADMFASAAAAGKRELVIKKSSQSPEGAAIESGRYDALFSVTTLNHLQVSGFPEIKSVSIKISQLEQLLQLILSQNSLESLPDEINALQKLKFLDVSNNNISKIPPSLYELHSLHTLLLGHNSLTDESFPSLSPDSAGLLPNLHHVNLSGNSLTKLPEFVYKAHNIQELLASDNTISSLEPTIELLSALKLLDLKRNKLTTLPYELVTCSKLKTLGFEENPISDRRLLKLISQHGASKPKAVLDYISSHAPKPSTAAKSTSSKKTKGKKKASSNDSVPTPHEDDEEIVFAESKQRLCVVKPAHFIDVVATEEARKVRQYVVCAVVREVDLERGETFKEFIALQTKLHDTVCKRRRVATIATHDLNKLSPPLTYTCLPADAISLTPLGWTESLTAKEFVGILEASKRDKRGTGGKKAAAPVGSSPQDTLAAALSKYVQFVNPAGMVCFQDNTGTVISLPPLTNSESTKIESSSRDILLEVSSSDSLASCKSVMDSLVYGMCEAGVGVGGDGVMHVEQGRVVDEKGQLLVIYPSRTDLKDKKFEVIHP